jgi:(2S)-methylsuccinyl-CoA dehydrogenase
MKTLTATETMSDRLIPLLDAAADAAETLGAAATKTVKAKIAPDGKIDNAG